MWRKKYLVLFLLIFGACGVNPAERNNAGNQLYESAKYDEAIRAYYLAQVENPNDPVPYFNVSGPLMQSGRFSESIATLEQALETDDNDMAAKAYYNIGVVYFQQSQYNDAATAFRESLMLNPSDHDARYNYELAMLYNLPPTPTALEQKIEPETGDTDRDATPTPNPVDIDGPTPTPTPPQAPPPDPSQTPLSGVVGDFSGATPGTPLPRFDATLSIEEAQRQLDALEQDQHTFQEFQQDIITPQGTPSGKDW